MKVLITGGGGYIGNVLVDELLRAGHRVVVLDRFYFGESIFEPHPSLELVRADLRTLDPKVLAGVDVTMDLAALSNDPSADLEPRLTEEINRTGAVRLATLAREAGVRRHVFSSSCSVYGESATPKPLTEKDDLHPVSLYAQTKVRAEREILALDGGDFCVTALRNATVYGVSRRMRFDLVVNLMTLYAVRNKKIFVLGGGKQWRPLVHVRDVARAFMLVAEAPVERVRGQAFNVGSDEQNHTVAAIASIVAQVVPNTEIEHVPDDPDKRTYHVSFEKIRSVLGFLPTRTVEDGVREVLAALQSGLVDDSIKTKTVAYYRYLLEAERLVRELSMNGHVL